MLRYGGEHPRPAVLVVMEREHEIRPSHLLSAAPAHLALVGPSLKRIGQLRGAAPLMIAAPFSPIVIVGALVLPEVTAGVIEALLNAEAARLA